MIHFVTFCPFVGLLCGADAKAFPGQKNGRVSPHVGLLRRDRRLGVAAGKHIFIFIIHFSSFLCKDVFWQDGRLLKKADLFFPYFVFIIIFYSFFLDCQPFRRTKIQSGFCHFVCTSAQFSYPRRAHQSS